MKLEYTLTKENYLEFLLYDYSTKQLETKKDRNTLIGKIIFALILLFVFLKFDYPYIFALFLYFVYEILKDFFYHKDIIKKNTLKLIKKKYSNNIDYKYISILENDYFVFKERYEEIKIEKKNVSQIILLKNTVLVKIVDESTFIISSVNIDTEKLINHFQSVDIPTTIALDWKW